MDNQKIETIEVAPGLKYITARGLLSVIQQVADVEFEATETEDNQSEGILTMRVEFKFTGPRYIYSKTYAQIREEKSQYSSGMEFFDSHALLLRKTHMIRTIFRQKNFMEVLERNQQIKKETNA